MKQSSRLVCFPPIIDKSCKVLILGTMPSVRSFKLAQYYGHPQNQFWKLIGALLNVEEWKDYEHKKRTILKHHIGLWDVVDSCLREGSSDASIREHEVNDFPALLKKYPKIKVIICDSGTAYMLFKRHYKEFPIPVLGLPSPSARHTIPFAKKLARWKVILKYL